MPQTATTGQLGFNSSNQSNTINLISSDDSVEISDTSSEVDITVDLRKLASLLPDNGLKIGG